MVPSCRRERMHTEPMKPDLSQAAHRFCDWAKDVSKAIPGWEEILRCQWKRYFGTEGLGGLVETTEKHYKEWEWEIHLLLSVLPESKKSN